MMRTLLIALILFFALTSWAFALVHIEKDGIFFYFPENEKEIASPLTEKLPEMIAFLALWKLPVKHPIHIILDDKLDAPEVEVHIIPHREIRIPIRAPGVLEDGYTEADPWEYFIFKGLCLQGIYGIRSGIPGFFHKVFGEIISPNVIMPQWVEEGICSLMYALYRQKEIQDPFESAIFQASPPPDLDIVSNHPQIWPGNQGYRIYGKPFIYWLYRKYGWEKIIDFLRSHGRGLIPIEIDLKARQVFGKTGVALWREFQNEHTREPDATPGLLITGYWSEPFVFWNQAGVYPGKLKIRNRGRYGYAEPDGTLWVSEYDKASKIYKYSKGTAVSTDTKHLWDPGLGRVAVTRKGHLPQIIVFPNDSKGGFRLSEKLEKDQVETISAPPGILQLSGPVRDKKGRIAVAGNLAGNWDIWVFDGQWHRMTNTLSIEMDPWWENDSLVYVSNISGRFQIHGADQSQITHSEYGAILPRQGQFLNLIQNGWQVQSYEIGRQPFTKFEFLPESLIDVASKPTTLETKPYDPFKSVWPNYIRPDIFIGATDLQLGIATKSRDVTGNYATDAGIRYSFDSDYLALRAAFQARQFGTQYTRYPLSYQTALAQKVDESRNEIKLFWRPTDLKKTKRAEELRSSDGTEFSQGIELSVNWRNYKPLEEEGPTEDEFWAALAVVNTWGILRGWGNLELLSEDRQSLSGGIRVLFGDQILTSIHMMGGRAWGESLSGHNAFRIGGNVIEGYFTRRPSKLFPIRGFDSNILDAPKAASTGIEVFWPMANLQTGYETLPLFFHRLRLGTFVDAGFAGEDITGDDLLVGGGFELVTSLEIAWGNLSSFRIGISWPLVQPDYLDQKGPLFIFQIGRPL
ncbi:MAG: hypothetical protein OEM90_08585 [Desulfobacteraceae bacterium]|nr:hypothetical protein [Desulfobacteraceae bacterium]